MSQGGAADPCRAAEGLLSEFGTLAAALAGTKRRQMRATDNDVAAVRSLGEFKTMMTHALEAQLESRPLVANSYAAVQYLRADMAHLPFERLRVLYLDAGRRLIANEVACDGTVDQAAFYVREVLRRALDHGASCLVVAHNHPSGRAEPSMADTSVTRRLADACRAMEITLLDHIIVAREDHVSLRALNLL